MFNYIFIIDKNLTVNTNYKKIKKILQVGDEQLLQSKNYLSDLGFTVGESVEKDMDNQNYTNEFDPYIYQSSFRFTVNNVYTGSSYNRTLSTSDESVTIDPSCVNTTVVHNFIFSYIVLVTNITSESESVVILQDSTVTLFD